MDESEHSCNGHGCRGDLCLYAFVLCPNNGQSLAMIHVPAGNVLLLVIYLSLK